MYFWNVKTSTLQGCKTKNRYFEFGEEVPESEIGDPERVKAMVKRGWIRAPKSAKPEKKGK